MKEEDKQYLSQVGMYLVDLFYNKKNINMKQTAVEWLEQRLFDSLGKFTKGDIDQAKAMEKEQIENAFNYGQFDLGMEADEYYNETFKSE